MKISGEKAYTIGIILFIACMSFWLIRAGVMLKNIKTPVSVSCETYISKPVKMANASFKEVVSKIANELNGKVSIKYITEFNLDGDVRLVGAIVAQKE